MIIAVFILGLALGSFINALNWRVHQQEFTKPSAKKRKGLSVTTGRSMCVNCHQQLAWYDLIPVVSWVALKGKCRYCHKSISIVYPVVELATSAIFVTSYLIWPVEISGLSQIASFVLWQLITVGLIALLVFDLKHMILPDKIMKPMYILATLFLAVQVAINPAPSARAQGAFWGVIVLFGLFFLLFQISKGRWIGGGDVKLAFVIGLLVGGPVNVVLVLFLSSLAGTIFGLPVLLTKRARNIKVPYGPFLIIATYIVFFYGSDISVWYQTKFLLF